MKNKNGHNKGKEHLNGEVREAMIEIEHLLRELERSKSVALGDVFSTRLETIEHKLGNLERLFGSLSPANAPARLDDLMEQIIASRIRSDLESSVQALHLVQSYLRDHTQVTPHADFAGAPSSVRSDETTPSPSDDTLPAGTPYSGTTGPGGENAGNAFERILRHTGTKDRDAVMRLSKRKREVLYHLLLGKSNRTIAAELGITEKTVKNNLYNMYRILQVKSRSQLIHRLLNPFPEEIIQEV